MADKDTLSRLKISKKTYVFDTRRKYAAARTFALKKKPENTADELKEKLSGMLSGRKEEGEKKEAAPAQAKPPGMGIAGLSGGTRTALIILLVVVAFAVASMAYLGFVLGTTPPEPPAIPHPDVFSGSYSFSIGKAELISVAQNDRIGSSAYALVRYSASNVSYLNFTANTYLDHPATQVFLLDYARDSADSYPVFRKSLMDSMDKAGLSLNEIDIEHVASLPAGAALIVPTGYLPKEFLGMGSSFDFKKLMAQGVTIIYIGKPFDSTVLDQSGITLPSTVQTGLTFNKLTRSRLDSTGGFHLFDAQYTVAPSEMSSGVLSSGGQAYGSVSVIKSRGGAMIFLPASLDGGWGAEGGELAASDMVKLLREEPWLVPVATANASANLNAAGETSLSIFTTPFDGDSAYVKLAADSKDSDGTLRRSLQVLRVQRAAKGEMTPRDLKILPFYLSGARNRLNIDLRETDPSPVKLWVNMYKDEVQLQHEELELGLTNPTTEKTYDFQVNAEPGQYVVRVEDASNKAYAACELDVIDIDVEIGYIDWGRGSFPLTLSSQYGSVNPKSLAVSLDGRGEMRFSPSSLVYKDGKTSLVYVYTGEKIQEGSHALSIESGENWKRALQLFYRAPRNFWDNPIVLVLGLMSAAIFGVGLLLRRPETLRYGLDIPDFPPLSTIKIPIKTETVLEIFDSVNASYSWQYMPLRLDELKNGFRRLTFNGKPILIGDFNLERVLAKMRDKGHVKDELGYWGKTSWERDSGKSIHYLTIYRILRNVLVNSAVKFSKLGSMQDCDVKALAGKDEIYFHIMEEPYEKLIHRALATSKKGTTIMVFKTDEEVGSFKEMLTSTSKLAVGLKMEVNNGNIMMLPVKNAISAYLKQIIK